MSLSKRKFWYFSDCLHFSKCAAPLRVYLAGLFTTILHYYINIALLRFIHRWYAHRERADMQSQSIACTILHGFTISWRLEARVF